MDASGPRPEYHEPGGPASYASADGRAESGAAAAAGAAPLSTGGTSGNYGARMSAAGQAAGALGLPPKPVHQHQVGPSGGSPSGPRAAGRDAA